MLASTTRSFTTSGRASRSTCRGGAPAGQGGGEGIREVGPRRLATGGFDAATGAGCLAPEDLRASSFAEPQDTRGGGNASGRGDPAAGAGRPRAPAHPAKSVQSRPRASGEVQSLRVCGIAAPCPTTAQAPKAEVCAPWCPPAHTQSGSLCPRVRNPLSYSKRECRAVRGVFPRPCSALSPVPTRREHAGKGTHGSTSPAGGLR